MLQPGGYALHLGRASGLGQRACLGPRWGCAAVRSLRRPWPPAQAAARRGTNSAAVGFRAPLLGAGFSPGTWGTVQACQEDQRCCGKTGKLEAAQQPLRSRVLGRKRWDSPPRGDGAAMPSR